MAVAATFLTVSTSGAFAQTAPASDSAAELAIDAAVPVPDTSLVPPPTAADVASAPTAADDKTETTASTTPPDAPAASVTEAPAATPE
ncbi:MAG: murein L,D-transpeptidase, partial [Xanthobacteraceae bacterium]